MKKLNSSLKVGMQKLLLRSRAYISPINNKNISNISLNCKWKLKSSSLSLISDNVSQVKLWNGDKIIIDTSKRIYGKEKKRKETEWKVVEEKFNSLDFASALLSLNVEGQKLIEKITTNKNDFLYFKKLFSFHSFKTFVIDSGELSSDYSYSRGRYL